MSRFLPFLVCLLVGGIALPSFAQEAKVKSGKPKPVKRTAAMKRLLGELRPIKPPTDAPELPEELAGLMDKMKRATAKNAKVYRPLTAEQLNFKPSNGTHTPRWNAEHISASQLKFFSEVYHKLESSIPVIDWSPKQMPADYQPAHPKWDGKKEAKRMVEVDQFCRRYAYLLADVDLDSKPPATFFPTYRAMLTTLIKHSGEHTDNVKEKFKADDWPEK